MRKAKRKANRVFHPIGRVALRAHADDEVMGRGYCPPSLASAVLRMTSL